MKLRDLKIGTQLRIGLGVILLFLGLLGALAWLQEDSIWKDTKGLYENPLMTRRAIGEIKTDILTMQLGLKGLFAAKNDQEREAFIHGMQTCETDAMRQFDNLNKSYLGPRGDVVDAQNGFMQWTGICNETVRLLRAGKDAGALNNEKLTGDGDAKAVKLLGLVDRKAILPKTSPRNFSSTRKNKKTL